MNNEVKEVFKNIKASERLKAETILYLHEKKEKKSRELIILNKKIIISLFSFIFIIATTSFFYHSYFTTSTYIDIDINPALELSLNRFNKVIAIHAYNDDASQIINEIDLKYQDYNKAIKMLVEKLVSRGYIVEDELLSIAVNSNNEKNFLNELELYLNNLLNENNDFSINIEIFSVDNTVKAVSHDLNISAAKYQAILQLQEVYPEITIEQCSKHTISELHELTNRHGGSEGNHGNGNKHNHH